MSRPKQPFQSDTQRKMAAVARQVDQPLMFSTQLDERSGTLIASFSGRERTGANARLLGIGRMRAKINVAESATFSTSRYGGAFFEFRHIDFDKTPAGFEGEEIRARIIQELKEFEMELHQEFESQTRNLPVPAVDREFLITVITRPDSPNQLGPICTLFAERDAPINILAMLGRRQPERVPGSRGEYRFFSQLDFVVGFPPELSGTGEELRRQIEGIGLSRGECWEVSVREFDQSADADRELFIGLLAGQGFPSDGGGTCLGRRQPAKNGTKRFTRRV